mmetsp:Transcript_33784/g.107289  ORF Transcript_33784/g.107289 Transcript_33784/m.107289 type:complete len:361 (-) Transcript_33784:43-1125(-)
MAPPPSHGRGPASRCVRDFWRVMSVPSTFTSTSFLLAARSLSNACPPRSPRGLWDTSREERAGWPSRAEQRAAMPSPRIPQPRRQMPVHSRSPARAGRSASSPLSPTKSREKSYWKGRFRLNTSITDTSRSSSLIQLVANSIAATYSSRDTLPSPSSSIHLRFSLASVHVDLADTKRVWKRNSCRSMNPELSLSRCRNAARCLSARFRLAMSGTCESTSSSEASKVSSSRVQVSASMASVYSSSDTELSPSASMYLTHSSACSFCAMGLMSAHTASISDMSRLPLPSVSRWLKTSTSFSTRVRPTSLWYGRSWVCRTLCSSWCTTEVLAVTPTLSHSSRYTCRMFPEGTSHPGGLQWLRT